MLQRLNIKGGTALLKYFTVLVILHAAVPAEAVVAFRSSATASAASGTTVAITANDGAVDILNGCGNITPSIPAGNVGDLLIAQVVAREDSALVSMPGWNTLFSDNVAGEEYQVLLFYRIATGGDSNTITQTGPPCDLLMGQISRYDNVDTTLPFEFDVGNWVYSDAGNVDTGSQTVTLAGSLLILASFVADNRTLNEDGSFTELYDSTTNTGGDGGISLNYRTETAAGTQGPFMNMDLQAGGSDPNHGLLFAVRPAASNNLTINVPGGTVSGDVMIASITVRPSTVGISTPGGWTLIRSVTQAGGNSSQLATYYRVADGSEPASYTWAFAASHTGAVGSISSYTGVHNTTPIDDENGNATAAGLTHAAPSVTSTIANSMLVTVHEFTSAQAWTPPGGMTEIVDIGSIPTSGGGISMEVNYESLPISGATGTRTATAAASADTGATQSVVLLSAEITCSTTLATGLPGDYFNNMTLAGTAAGTRIDAPVDFNWGNGAPGVAGIGTDLFSIRWDGILRTTVTGNYQFQTVSDDGVRLWVNNILVIDNWTNHAATTDTSGNVALTAGQIYSIRLEFYENGGQAEIRLRWQRPGDVTFTAIPTGPSPALGGGLYYCPVVTAGLQAHYSMDEALWNGTANEVQDISGNTRHGAAAGGANTLGTTPAITGSPGTCRYGTFDGADDYVQVANLSNILSDTASLAFWIRTTQTGSDTGWQAPGISGVELAGGGDDIFWGWLDATGNIGISVGDDYTTKSVTAVNDDVWHHIVLTRDQVAGAYQIYIDGTLNTSGAIATGVIGTAFSSIGRIEDTGGTPVYFNGLLDEARIYDAVLSTLEVINVMNATRACISTDHFDINHDGTAVTCQAEPITIEAHLSDHTIDTSYTGSINLSTSTTNGDWTVITGTNPVVNGVADDGAATYLIDALDLGTVVLGLKNTHTETLNINVGDGVISELSGTALASEDANLVFAESGFQFLADGVASSINNQIGGKASSVAPGNQTLELQAIQTSDSTGQCEAALQGNVTIQLAFECRNPTTCTANQVNINGGTPTNIAGNPFGPIAAWTNVSLDFGNAADTTATFVMNYSDVGQLQLYARYNMPLDDPPNTPSGVYMLGNSNAFVVRPFGFYIDVTGNPAASAALPAGPATTFTQAGANFTVTSTAVLWDAADDADNDGIPDGHETADTDETNNTDLSNNTAALNYGQETATENVALGSVLDQPVGGADPNLSGTTTISSFVNGVGSSNAVAHNEVGIIEITANHADGNYLGEIGAIGKSGYVGRFIPDHFALSVGMISNRVALSCVPASTFTYMEENQRLEFTLTAQNVGNGTTTNYRAGFAYLDLSVPANLNIGAIDTIAPTPLTARVIEISSSGAWVNGVSNPVFATISLDRDAVMANNGPFTNLSWGIAPTDIDNVGMNAFNLDVDNNATNDHTLVTSNTVRFGRAFVESTSGSELLALVLPLRAEYWNGTQFILNTNDSCTTYNAAALTYSIPVPVTFGVTTNGATGTLDQGEYGTVYPPILVSSNAQQTGSICVAHTVPGYLRFNWAANPSLVCIDPDGDPSAKATFGIFDINPRLIYIREVY